MNKIFLWFLVISNSSSLLLTQDEFNSIVSYQKCEDRKQLNFQPFPISYSPEFQLHNPIIAEKFILSIPHGRVYSQEGLIIVNNKILTDFIWPINVEKRAELENLDPLHFQQVTKIQGRCAVITQGGSWCYYHWITEVLGRLALLEQQNMTYDFLYVPVSKPYMKESLYLWGIDPDKIIEPFGEYEYIQADELIVPSLVDRVYPNLASKFANYPSPWIIQALRNKFLPKNNRLDNDHNYSKKIFISRKDASIRKFTNEDDLFNQLELQGFKRYCLTELSFLEQIMLFHHADIIVGAHGAGLVNLIFAQPGMHVIEIFQARADATYWYLSQTMGFEHTCIQTCAFDFNENSAGFFDTEIPVTAIEKIVSIVDALQQATSNVS